MTITATADRTAGPLDRRRSSTTPTPTSTAPTTPPAPARRQDDPLLTCREVAQLYRVHVETVRRWVRKGIITIVRTGPTRVIRIRRSDAAKYLVLVPGAET